MGHCSLVAGHCIALPSPSADSSDHSGLSIAVMAAALLPSVVRDREGAHSLLRKDLHMLAAKLHMLSPKQTSPLSFAMNPTL